MIFDEFERFCRGRGLSQKTAAQYRSHVKTFFDVNEFTSVSDFNFGRQKDYQQALENLTDEIRGCRNLSKTAVNGYFCALDTFFSWCIYNETLSINPIPFFRQMNVYYYKTPEPKQAYVPTLTEMRAFLETIDDDTIRAMLIIGSKTMMRKNEILTTRCRNINLDKRILIITEHSKRSNCMVFLDDESAEIISDLFRRKTGNSQFLFTTPKDRPYQRNSARDALLFYAERAGLYEADGPRELNFTWNSCRRFGNTELKKAGMDPDYIRWLRGDIMSRSADMTTRYRSIIPEDVRDAYEKHVFKFNL